MSHTKTQRHKGTKKEFTLTPESVNRQMKDVEVFLKDALMMIKNSLGFHRISPADERQGDRNLKFDRPYINDYDNDKRRQ